MSALELARAHAGMLLEVDGVVGVVLGGSHATGTARPESDVDLGVYYREPLDVARLGELASKVAGRPTPVAAPGEWGPWVDGGVWLDLADAGPVDWILRDLDRVTAERDRAERGEFGLHTQPGHPFGFVSTAYVGECASAIVVGDTGGELEALHERCGAYPDPLRDAFVGWLWEARFSLDVAAKAAGRGDASYVAMCVVRAVGIMAHALHADARSWVLNEKGMVETADALPGAPVGFAARAHRLCAGGGADAAALTATLADAQALLVEVAEAVGASGPTALRT